MFMFVPVKNNFKINFIHPFISLLRVVFQILVVFFYNANISWWLLACGIALLAWCNCLGDELGSNLWGGGGGLVVWVFECVSENAQEIVLVLKFYSEAFHRICIISLDIKNSSYLHFKTSHWEYKKWVWGFNMIHSCRIQVSQAE